MAKANTMGDFRTAHGWRCADFDHWKDGGKAGLPKEAGPDTPHSFDHVMVIFRNSVLGHGQEAPMPEARTVFGHQPAEPLWRACGMPFGDPSSEFTHLLFGGNNFHSGSGNAPAVHAGFFHCPAGGWA